MEWSKLKNIIILILAAANVMLAGLALFTWQRDETAQREAMANAVALLEEKNVSLNWEPEEMSLQVMEVQRDQGREDVLAAALLGETVKEDRGAGVYRYVSSRGVVQFHSNGEFSAAFPVGEFPLDGAAPEEHALKTLELLDFQGRVLEVREEDSRIEVTVCQTLGGTPVLSCTAVLVYEQDCLTAIGPGRRLNGTAYAAEGETPCISAASALIRLSNGLLELGDVSKTVTEVEEAYRLSSSFSGPIQLLPVWYITTDTGSYQLNAQTGELTRSVVTGGETMAAAS